MDPNVFDKNDDKPVYGVHLETAAMIQVVLSLLPVLEKTIQLFLCLCYTMWRSFPIKFLCFRWPDVRGGWWSTISGRQMDLIYSNLSLTGTIRPFKLEFVL